MKAQTCATPQVTRWGPWIYDPELNVIFHDSKWRSYHIDLDRMPDSAAVLDWIFQVTNKRWVSISDAGHLIEALRDTINPQATLCPFGMNVPRKVRK